MGVGLKHTKDYYYINALEHLGSQQSLYAISKSLVSFEGFESKVRVNRSEVELVIEVNMVIH